jgi:hypothetical protein
MTATTQRKAAAHKLAKSIAAEFGCGPEVYVTTATFKGQIDGMPLDLGKGWLISDRGLVQRLRAANAPIAPIDLLQCPCCHGIFRRRGPSAIVG